MEKVSPEDCKLLELSTSDLFFSQLLEQYEMMYVLYNSLIEKNTIKEEKK